MQNTHLETLAAARELTWLNPDLKPCREITSVLGTDDIRDAEKRLRRFAPLLMKYFPETAARGGIIESPLTEIPAMRERLNLRGAALKGRLLLKQDNALPIAGSVKARGGIYEVLKHTEELALRHGLLTEDDVRGDRAEAAYEALADEAARRVFAKYTVQVGSTGNLGMSIGIMSAAIGYHAVVHMSSDARQWKKDLLRAHGVTVVEYDSDYSEAVRVGRARSDADPASYFVDDENSRDLFLGYAVAGLRLHEQLRALGITVDETHPLRVYLPCGVGGAPGGIAFGLRHAFGDSAQCVFAEPVQAPCMLLGLISGRGNGISVQDIGLTGRTDADGLAVGRASGFVGDVIRPHLTGGYTVEDAVLYDYLRDLMETEGIFLEPSACAGFHGPIRMQEVLADDENTTHIVWATGGSLVPEEIRTQYLNTHIG